MKGIFKRMTGDQRGGALILTLVLLVIGGLILAPLLGHVGSGHIAGQVHEKRMDELYAADAGVEGAIWQIAKDPSAGVAPFIVNEKDVDVDIHMVACREYTITSEATTPGVSATKVEAFVYGFSFPDNAITSRFDVDLGNNSYVDGRIQYGRNLNYDPNSNFDRDNTIKEVYNNWPSGATLHHYYYQKHVADKHFVYCDDSPCEVDPKYTGSVGPLYVYNSMVVSSTDNKQHRELELTGTIYVAGDLTIGKTRQDFTLNLNGKTVFCEGDIYIGDKVDIIGSGSIIANGNIYFRPNFTSEDGYILLLALEGDIDFQPKGDFTGFVMSADGLVSFQPGGLFTGSVAGDVHVDLSSNVHVVYKSALDALIDFPFEAFANWRILSYNIYTETG